MINESPITSEIGYRHRSESKFRKWKRYITVEPVMFAINVPYCLLVICLQNLTLEKACRVNLGFPESVCDHMMHKDWANINCGVVSERQQSLLLAVNNSEYDSNASSVASSNMAFNRSQHDFETEVCRAERESQKLGSTISAYIAPFDSTIGMVLVLFAGSWSDRSGKRKPCILIPQIGESLGQLVALIAAIFMRQLPVEFNAILGALFPAICGSWALMSIGLFSYLTEITDEKDRVFRFGIMYQLYPIITICTLPFSGILFQTLGYVKLLSLCMLINFLGILYIVFVMDEVKPRLEVETERELTAIMLSERNSTEHSTEIEPTIHVEGKSLCTNVIKDCASVIIRKRNGHGRKIVCLILIIVGLSQALEYESENEYYFARTRLNWEALQEAPYAAYGSILSFVGTTFMITVMSKHFKVTDTVLAIVSSSFTTASKLVFITVTTTFMLYVAKTLDVFYGIISLVVRSIVSTVVENTEIGKIYSVMGVLENVSKFVFVPIYTNIYKHTVDTFPNAYFICSFAISIILTVLCWILYDWVKGHNRIEEEISESQRTFNEPCLPMESESTPR